MKKVLLERKNTHMEHLEDLIFNEGVEGTRDAINYLRGLRDMLAGHTTRNFNMTVKWDGAPAVFAGKDPRDGKFFVAKKGIFNKNPVVYKTAADIDADVKGDLAVKLKASLKYFSDLGIDGVIQGDLLYTADTLERKKIDGKEYIMFQANTIAYAVPADSVLARKILRSKIGVVWHTEYVGKDFESMRAVFGKPISNKLRKVTTVWHTDAMFRDVSGVATFNARETAHLTKLLAQIGTLFNRIPASALNDISKNEELLIRIKAYNNAHIRRGQKIGNVNKYAKEMIDYVFDFYTKKMNAMKSPRGKAAWHAKRKEAMSYFHKHSRRDIVYMLRLYNMFVEAKHMVVYKLNNVKAVHTFLRMRDGSFRTTTPEGYVAIDHIGNAIKLVDRLEFSHANFSDEYMKAWEK